MLDETGERMTRVNYQIKKWQERGVFEYVSNWALGAWGAGYKRAKIGKCLRDQGLLDVDLTDCECIDLAEALIGGMPKVNKDNIVDVLSGVMIRGLFKNNKSLIDRWLDMSQDKIKERHGLSVEDKKNEGVNIVINTGSTAGNVEVEDLTSEISLSGEDLSNIGTVDPLEDLKGDPAYDRLKKDRQEEEDS